MACAAGLLLGMTTGPIATASIPQDDVVSDVPALNTPQLVPSAGIDRPRANTVARLNGRVYVGGLFATASDRDSSRSDLQNLFAFSDPAYQLDGNFNARANGEGLRPRHRQRRPVRRRRLPHRQQPGDRPVGQARPSHRSRRHDFHPPFTTGAVNQVILKNGVLYVGGTFPGHLLALNPDTGANTGDINFTVSSPIPNAFGPVAIFKFAITNAGDRLVATGNFQQVNTSSRTRVFVADIDTATGDVSLDNWNYPGFAKPCSTTEPRRIAQLRGVDWSPTAATSSWSAPVRSRAAATSGTPRPRSTPPTRRCATEPAGST